MKFKDQKVLVQWTGEAPINARLVQSGQKVTFEPGMVRAMEIKKAEHVCGKYKKFIVVSLEDLDKATVDEYLAYEEEKKADVEAVKADEAKAAKAEAKRKAKEDKAKKEVVPPAEEAPQEEVPAGEESAKDEKAPENSEEKKADESENGGEPSEESAPETNEDEKADAGEESAKV